MSHGRYTPTSRVEAALRALFPGYSVARGLYGRKEPDLPFGNPLEPVEQRLDRVRQILEDYIVDMAAEYEELGEEEGERLRGEATGLVLALRELCREVPEALASTVRVKPSN